MLMPVTGMLTIPAACVTVISFVMPPALIITLELRGVSLGLGSQVTVTVTLWSDAEPLAGLT